MGIGAQRMETMVHEQFTQSQQPSPRLVRLKTLPNPISAEQVSNETQIPPQAPGFVRSSSLFYNGPFSDLITCVRQQQPFKQEDRAEDDITPLKLSCSRLQNVISVMTMHEDDHPLTTSNMSARTNAESLDFSLH